MDYTLAPDDLFGNCRGIIRNNDNAFIPPDLGNMDYREYLQAVIDGRAPEPLESWPKELG